ncbi:MAG: DUF3185 family protein [Burkholderiaceae bacterium]
MYKAIFLALLIGGIALLMFGNDEMNSFSSELSRMITNTPTDRAIGLMVGGIVMMVIGAVGIFSLPSGSQK